MLNNVLIHNEHGFSDGYTSILKIGDESNETGMNFACLKLCKNEQYSFSSSLEKVCLLMTGKVIFQCNDQFYSVERLGYFEYDPIAWHGSAHHSINIIALSDCELLIIEAENNQHFDAMLWDQNNLLESDHRGKNLLDDASYRIVRTMFDKRNRPESNLVVGEIITFQGRWSSYPPHYHSQPEVYHYRFSEPQGFALAENGETALKIKQYDTYSIVNKQEHAHCVAPGYALYTLWFIRHLPGDPYQLPTFRQEHEWTRYKSANSRIWK